MTAEAAVIAIQPDVFVPDTRDPDVLLAVIVELQKVMRQLSERMKTMDVSEDAMRERYDKVLEVRRAEMQVQTEALQLDAQRYRTLRPNLVRCKALAILAHTHFLDHQLDKAASRNVVASKKRTH